MAKSEMAIKAELDMLSDGDVKVKMAKAISIANFCGKVIANKKLYMDLRGAKYVYVRGWKLIANAVGLVPEIDSEKLKIERETRQESGVTTRILRVYAVAYLVDREGRKFGHATAVCSSEEKNWAGRDETAIIGMAQTRAIGRACKNALDWLVTLAGFADVPVEEVTDKSEPKGMSKPETDSIETE